MSIYKMRTEFGHHLKWVMGILAVIFVIGAIFTFGSAPSREGDKPGGADEQVATVNGMPISRGEVEATWGRVSEGLRNRGARSTLQYASERGRVFQQIVESRITLVSAQKLGVSISDRDVADKRDQMIETFLKDNRRSVLGKMSPEQDRTDPRGDSDYKSELAKGGMSIGQMEERAKTFVPEGQIQFELAQDGIRKALEQRAGDVTPAQIRDSYNVYSVRQIMVPKMGMPADQIKTRVDKIAVALKGGGDFVALAKQYSMDGAKGAVQSLSYEMMSPEVWDQLGKLKTGEVSSPIDTSYAVYIAKLEGVTQKLPAKFDKKAQNERKKMITGRREMQEYMTLNKEVRAGLVVDVKDPELKGYWHLAQLQQAQPDAKVDPKKQISLATSAFKKAVAKDANNQWATAMLAVLLKEQGRNDEAQVQLYHLLEGENSKGEGADLRIMLGDLLWKAGKKADAMKQYEKAVEAAGIDEAVHQQLAAKFKEIGRADLAAKEQATAADIQAKRKLYEAQQGKQGVPPTAPRP